MKVFKYEDFQKLTRGSEERNLEYKRSFEWKNKKQMDSIQARTIKAVISMANIPNGGKVVVGINENNGKKTFEGLSEKQLETFTDKDKIKKQIDSYIFHFVDFDIYKSFNKSKKISFIVFAVKEAIEYPLLTKSELKIKRGNIFETIIEPNCIYSRSLSGDNSSEKITQSELNEIVSHSYQLKYSKNAIEESSDNTNKGKDFSLLLSVVIRILSSVRQYDKKHGDSLSMMKSSLKLYEDELQVILLNNEDTFADDLKVNIQKILNGLESANNHQMYLGAESWNEYKGYIETVHSASEEVLNTFKKNFDTSNLDIDQNIKQQFKYIKNWLQKYNQFKYKEYLSKSYEYSNISLQLGYYAILTGDQRGEQLLQIGDTFLKHSMGQGNVGFMEVEKDIPILVNHIDSLFD